MSVARTSQAQMGTSRLRGAKGLEATQMDPVLAGSSFYR